MYDALRFGSARPDRRAIAACASRFVVAADGVDDDMTYFNDFVAIVECAERAGRVFQFDPVAGEIMTEPKDPPAREPPWPSGPSRSAGEPA